MIYVHVLPSLEPLSDHAHILLTTGTLMPQCSRPFKFELGWLYRDGFLDMVKNMWEKPLPGSTPIQRWNNKLHSMHRYLWGGLAICLGSLNKKNSAYHLILMT
jgi:hypothetical protein